jgi:hypothetical protein
VRYDPQEVRVTITVVFNPRHHVTVHKVTDWPTRHAVSLVAENALLEALNSKSRVSHRFHKAMAVAIAIIALLIAGCSTSQKPVSIPPLPVTVSSAPRVARQASVVPDNPRMFVDVPYILHPGVWSISMSTNLALWETQVILSITRIQTITIREYDTHETVRFYRFDPVP